ncbi:MAG: COP23 domain-containing protein [Pleurocapsa sp.]
MTLAFIALSSTQGGTASAVEITCDRQADVPTVIATLSNQQAAQITPILSFLPQYFSAESASILCSNTAEKLNAVYGQGQMNYLASDTIDAKPVVCAVERRGLACDSYNSEVLFSLNEPVDPTELLYNMLGDNFKGSQLPSSRTVSRIYSDLRPLWWPF